VRAEDDILLPDIADGDIGEEDSEATVESEEPSGSEDAGTEAGGSQAASAGSETVRHQFWANSRWHSMSLFLRAQEVFHVQFSGCIFQTIIMFLNVFLRMNYSQMCENTCNVFLFAQLYYLGYNIIICGITE